MPEPRCSSLGLERPDNVSPNRERSVKHSRGDFFGRVVWISTSSGYVGNEEPERTQKKVPQWIRSFHVPVYRLLQGLVLMLDLPCHTANLDLDTGNVSHGSSDHLNCDQIRLHMSSFPTSYSRPGVAKLLITSTKFLHILLKCTLHTAVPRGRRDLKPGIPRVSRRRCIWMPTSKGRAIRGLGHVDDDSDTNNEITLQAGWPPSCLNWDKFE